MVLYLVITVIKTELAICDLRLNFSCKVEYKNFLLSYDTTDRVCDIVKIVKQETTCYLWHKYSSFLSKQYWKKKIFWSDGYFACSIGEVSSTTIQKYIENQG